MDDTRLARIIAEALAGVEDPSADIAIYALAQIPEDKLTQAMREIRASLDERQRDGGSGRIPVFGVY